MQLEPETVREAMQREIATINPDPAYFRSFPDAQVMVNGRAAERVLLVVDDLRLAAGGLEAGPSSGSASPTAPIGFVHESRPSRDR